MDASKPTEGRSADRPVDLGADQAQGLPVRSRQEMDAFVRAYQDRVFNVIYRMCGHHEDAMELTQETFCRAIQSAGGFRGGADVFTWLYRIATNLTISHHRKTARRRVGVSLDDPFAASTGGGPAATVVSGEPGPEEIAAAGETHERIMSALDHLDADHRAVVILRDVEDLDYREISEIVGVPVGTVKSRIHRGRMILRERLKDLVGPTTEHPGES